MSAGAANRWRSDCSARSRYWSGGRAVPLGAPKLRAVLAVLALRIGSAVSIGDFEWTLWGDREPATADKALQGYISTLRAQLGAEVIETTPQGYRLLGSKELVDTFRFERRSERGARLARRRTSGLRSGRVRAGFGAVAG